MESTPNINQKDAIKTNEYTGGNINEMLHITSYQVFKLTLVQRFLERTHNFEMTKLHNNDKQKDETNVKINRQD